MKKILILSNTAASNSEANGRIHKLHFLNYISEKKLYNFYLTGSPDCPDINYLTFSNKAVLNSKFLNKKPSLIEHEGLRTEGLGFRKSKKSKFVFFHYLRNFCYSKNKKVKESLDAFIQEKEIDAIVIWGCNVPFLYEYALYLSKKHNIKLITFTGEDYPLKKYNYISHSPSIWFRSFQRKLNKTAFDVYQNAYSNIFATNDLLEAYKEQYKCNNSQVIHFSSEMKASAIKSNSIKEIVYAGNLYNNRVESIIDVAKKLSNNSNLFLYIYGNASKKIQKEFAKFSNIKYCGIVPYSKLVSILENADMLIHVEGFSKYYIKDCKFAFSTKISDYFLLNKPFFVYGPLEISGVKFAYNLNPDFVAIDKEQLSKLDEIINGKKSYKIDYDFLVENFDAKKNADRMFNILEE